MPLATYYKAPPQSPITPYRRLGIIPIGLMITGALMIGVVVGPIASYLLITSPNLTRQQLVSPLPSSAAVLGAQALAAVAVYDRLDYRKPENWFPDAAFPLSNPTAITHYNLSIPKIGIENAVVEIGGKDLSSSLIHYPGTANPGELGAPVIFGHSILRQFFNSKNYISIFSTIMTLVPNDVIEVKFDGVKYTFRVIDKIEVKPTDIQILQQQYNGRFLKLVTCVPEGTYLRRGVVIAQLVE